MKWINNPWVWAIGGIGLVFLMTRKAGGAEAKIAAETAKSQAQGLAPINPNVVVKATQAQLDALRALQKGEMTVEQQRLLTEQMVLESGVMGTPEEGPISEWRLGVPARPGTTPMY